MPEPQTGNPPSLVDADGKALAGVAIGTTVKVVQTSLALYRVGYGPMITADIILDALTDWEDVQRQREREQVQEAQLQAVPA